MQLITRPDPAHNLLLPFIKVTKDLLHEILLNYDHSAECRITPAGDLGFPHDVVRIMIIIILFIQ